MVCEAWTWTKRICWTANVPCSWAVNCCFVGVPTFPFSFSAQYSSLDRSRKQQKMGRKKQKKFKEGSNQTRITHPTAYTSNATRNDNDTTRPRQNQRKKQSKRQRRVEKSERWNRKKLQWQMTRSHRNKNEGRRDKNNEEKNLKFKLLIFQFGAEHYTIMSWD